VPIYQTTSYAFDNTQHGADLFDLKVAGNIYTRIMNPTQDVLEKRIAAMEGGIAGLALASGHGGDHRYAIQTIAEAGDNIVSRRATLYGGTYNLFAHTFPQYGIDVRFADFTATRKLFRAADRQPGPRPSTANRSATRSAISPTSKSWPRSPTVTACR
jgi:O-acetylhomoserine (thiol)-lyase